MTLLPLVHLHQKDFASLESGPRYIIPRRDSLPSDRQRRGMSDGISDSRGRQSTLDKPPQNNYVKLMGRQQEIIDELFYLRHEWEDNKRDLFDLTELIGRLAAKIEEWVGVTDE